ncbi:LPXTG cell wall anchor domain-containing protein [Enterococcus faecalis]|uniref:LPXTG cell wall anchor domain-containing protein n=1 Tax=Enterococcus faecalis TaxID=1351 RepID=UPI000459AF7E|nr:LPXTG cell wall anchor domain-containing protein [Enterococcus faecalis]KAJ61009.1 cell wall surface anchor family protein [Enterococcus faecalis KS19]
MEKFIKLSIFFLFACLAFSFAYPTYALEREYDSNGQTSFYGKYEYDDEDGKGEKGNSESDKGNNPKDAVNADSENKGSPNYSSTGQNLLPNTGGFVNPLFPQIGVLIVICTIGISVYISKRKEGKNK